VGKERTLFVVHAVLAVAIVAYLAVNLAVGSDGRFPVFWAVVGVINLTIGALWYRRWRG
jgi:predicted membrane channel-forming protein YqfA (hemolysin III family)